MMIGEAHHHYHTSTVHSHPCWVSHTDTTAAVSSPIPTSPLSVTTIANGPASPTGNSYLLSNYDAVLTALSRYLPSNEPDGALLELSEMEDGIPIDGAFAKTDDFRMYEFKVRRCTRAKAHDWTECPFAHPGEKARRRDPRRYSYSGTACTDFRKGSCRRGDACEFAHGVFECWLHPTRYRTQACKDGPNCSRRVCFFAHTPEQLRVLSGQPSPRSMGSDPFEEGIESSPPLTPIGRSYGSGSVNELVVSLRNLQLNKMNSMPNGSGWNVQMGMGSPRIGSTMQPGFYSLPSTPTNRAAYMDGWENEREAVAMERVESGRELRARMYEKLSKENPLTLTGAVEPGPDVDWVTDLVG